MASTPRHMHVLRHSHDTKPHWPKEARKALDTSHGCACGRKKAWLMPHASWSNGRLCAYSVSASGNTQKYINVDDFGGAFLVPRLHSVTENGRTRHQSSPDTFALIQTTITDNNFNVEGITLWIRRKETFASSSISVENSIFFSSSISSSSAILETNHIGFLLLCIAFVHS